MPRAGFLANFPRSKIVAGSRRNFGYLHEIGHTTSSAHSEYINFYLKLTTEGADLRVQCMAGLLRSVWRARASVIIDLGNNS
jgi:hypothetical protein